MTQRLQVLVSAYACRPGEGSEPGIGWDVVRELVKYHDVWVLTRANNRPAIEAELSTQPVPSLHFVYVDLPKWATWWKRGQRGVHFHYYLWQIAAYRTACRLLRDRSFDLIHHVTYVMHWGPSFLALLPIPFVWGPVGGGETMPAAFWRDFGWRNRLYEVARDLARWVGEHDPFVRQTARRSVLARATTADTAERVRALGAQNVEVYTQVGLSQAQIDELAACAHSRPTARFISIGRLLHWKGFHLGLQAFAQANLPDAEYWIVGDGPDRPRLQQLAEQLGIASQVKFHGRLSRSQTLQQLADCIALIHPSLHESGGVVCAEAMAAGRPVVCLNLGGPAVLVSDQTGFRVAAHTPQQAIAEIAAAMTRLATDPDLWQQMSQAAQQRVSDTLSWEIKGQQLARLYCALLQRPDSEFASSDRSLVSTQPLEETTRGT